MDEILSSFDAITSSIENGEIEVNYLISYNYSGVRIKGRAIVFFWDGR